VIKSRIRKHVSKEIYSICRLSKIQVAEVGAVTFKVTKSKAMTGVGESKSKIRFLTFFLSLNLHKLAGHSLCQFLNKRGKNHTQPRCTNHSRRLDNHSSNPVKMNNRSCYNAFNDDVFNPTDLQQQAKSIICQKHKVLTLIHST
jgi:hypothetical protein